MLKYRLRKLGRKKTIFWSVAIILFFSSMISIVRYYAEYSHAISNAPSSGLNSNSGTVYVNDLDSDWYYYQSLNYTQVTSRLSLPTKNLSRYTESNLVAVQITYDGADIAGKKTGNDIKTGYVSYNESYSKFVYYKYYPVVDGKITIELPDNPYSMRPTNYGFNGWYCNPTALNNVTNAVPCSNMNFYLDKQYYTRYLEVSGVTSSTKSLVIYLNASWIDAKINNTYGTALGQAFSTNNRALLTAGMHAISSTTEPTVTEKTATFRYYDYDHQFIAEAGVYVSNRTTQNNRTIPAGSYLVTDLINMIAVYNPTNSNCAQNMVCTYLTEKQFRTNPENLPYNANYDWDSSTIYYSLGESYEQNGVTYFPYSARNQNGDWHLPRIATTDPINVNSSNVRIYDSAGNLVTNVGTADVTVNGVQWSNGTDLTGYYYLQNSPNSSSDYKYVNANGENCSKVSCVSGSTYKRLDSTDSEANWTYSNYSLDLDGYTLVSRPVISLPDHSTKAADLGKYYILTTRDTNIINLSANVYLSAVSNEARENRPFTLTSSHDGNKSTTYNVSTGTQSGNNTQNKNFHAGSDMVIENLNFRGYSLNLNTDGNEAPAPNDNYNNTGTSSIYSYYVSGSSSSNTEWHSYNVKMGRNVGPNSTNNNSNITGTYVIGGLNSKMIVESGYYNTGSTLPINNVTIQVNNRTVTHSAETTDNHMYAVYGSDFDRAAGNNGNLRFQYQIAGANFKNAITHDKSSSSDYTPISETTIKSGSYGVRALANLTVNAGNSRYASGAYAGGLGTNGASISGIASLTIEGGRIFCINGGPSIVNGYAGNHVAIRVKGGEIENITGGAGVTQTRGNRIVSVTSGTINNSVAGGSNSSISGGSSPGAMAADTLVYIGGNAVIGTRTDGLFYVNPGDVFGAGLGRDDEYTHNNNNYSSDVNRKRGVVNNSHVIINGDSSSNFSINGNVFGGGNFGATGIQQDANTSTTIDILDGSIKGSVFGGANKNGAGKSGYTHQVTINMSGGTVGTAANNKSVYGGSNEHGTVYGNVTMNMTGGTVTGDIYGGGYGGTNNVNDTTAIQRNVVVNIDGVSAKNVYGGSALGRVNGTNASTNTYTTSVTVNSGTVSGAVFGCGKGESTYAYPYTYGQSTVTINGGTIGEVYGGNDLSGTAYHPAYVYLNGGTVTGSVYGGSNQDDFDSTYVYLQEGNGKTLSVGNIFGGSNVTGITGDNYVKLTKGTVTGNVYGGNNVGGRATKTYVSFEGGNIQGDVYGCGKGSGTYCGNTQVYVNISDSLDHSAVDVYGGGEEAGVNNSGGSNSPDTKVLVVNGKIHDVYGGSNNNGTVTLSNVYITNGEINSVFGGNNKRGGTVTANVRVGSGTINEVYGGGNQISTTNPNVYIYGGNINNVFGGGKSAGVTGNTTHVEVYGGTVNEGIYGGSNINGDITNTLVNIKGTTTNYTCGNTASMKNMAIPCYSPSATISLNDIYGANNAGGTVVNTAVNIYNGTVANNVFGGGNQASVTSQAVVKMYGGEVYSVFGGGNESYVGETNGQTYVYIANGTVNKHVYGSGNMSYVKGATNVYIGDQAKSTLGINGNCNILIKGSVFGGSETNSEGQTTFDYSYNGVIGTTTMYIGAKNYNNTDITINGSLIGWGNNSAVTETAKIYINDYGLANDPKLITSIQRANKVYVTDSSIELNGARDRTVDKPYLYGLVRIDDFYLLGTAVTGNTPLKGSSLYMKSGTTYLHNYHSGRMNANNFGSYNDANFTPQETTISNNTVTNRYSDNKLFMLTNIVYSVVKGSEPSYEPNNTASGFVDGLTYLGMYYVDNNGDHVYGIYNPALTGNSNISDVATQITGDSSYTFVYGKHCDNGKTDCISEGIVTLNGDYGFYSHYVDEEDSSKMVIDYVGVTPSNDTYYKWVLGEVPAEIEVNLQATKYSVEGTANALIGLDVLKEAVGDELFPWKDAEMTITSVNTNGFTVTSSLEDVTQQWETYLVDRSKIDTVNISDENNDGVVDANNYFALSMGTTTVGWNGNYRTNLYDEGESIDTSFCTETTQGDCTGDRKYVYDSTRVGRNLSFWLYYSKNLDFSYSTYDNREDHIISLGSVVVMTSFRNVHGNPGEAATTQTVKIIINITMTDSEFDGYGYAVTPGQRYEVFPHTEQATIANNGVISIYQSLSLDLTREKAGHPGEYWSADELYGQAHTTQDGHVYGESFRALYSDYLFPVGTKITMLDLASKEEYYYTVNTTNYQTSSSYYNSHNGRTRYLLEDFIKMGSTDTTTNKYDDDMRGENSTKYYTHSGNVKVMVEEFIFTVDLSDVPDANLLDTTSQKYLYMQISRMEDGEETAKIGPVGVPERDMIYIINSDVNSEIDTKAFFMDESGNRITDGSGNPAPISIYKKNNALLDVDVSLSQKDSDGHDLSSVANTSFDNYKLGATITIWHKDANNQYVQMTNNLLGTVITINGEDYYPQVDGSIRIPLARRISDVISDISVDLENSELAFGDYQLRIETFASYDGLYAASSVLTTNKTLYFTLLNDQYGIDVTLPSVEVTHDVNNGEDVNGSRVMNFEVLTKNGLANPSIRVKIQRRTYGNVYDKTYENVSFDGLVSAIYLGDSTTNLMTSENCKLSTDGLCYEYYLTNLNHDLDNVQTTGVKLELNAGPSASDLSDRSHAKWKSGTYRVVFTMYDGDTPVGSVYEYLLIRSLDIDELINGGS